MYLVSCLVVLSKQNVEQYFWHKQLYEILALDSVKLVAWRERDADVTFYGQEQIWYDLISLAASVRALFGLRGALFLD